MRKRQKLVLTAILLMLGMWGIWSVGLDWKYPLIGLLTVVSYLMSAWALKEGLTGVEWVMVPLPPTLFTASVALFYILLPQSIWVRLLIGVLYGVGQYVLLLTANIFSVAAIRTIALFRAALAVGFVMTILTGFFLYDTILSFRLPFWALMLWVAFVSIGLLMPGLWSVNLEKKISKTIIGYSIWLSAVMGIIAGAISIWPISIAVASLFLCTMLYIMLGISQHHFSQRLFSKTVWEYVTVGAVVLVTMLLASGRGV